MCNDIRAARDDTENPPRPGGLPENRSTFDPERRISGMIAVQLHDLHVTIVVRYALKHSLEHSLELDLLLGFELSFLQ